jgi:glycosyltransferase involved in cell wall biosynthesis
MVGAVSLPSVAARCGYSEWVNAPDVVCFSGQDWWYHNRAHSDFQLMLRVAEVRRVLLVNSIGMRLPVPGRSSQPFRRMARKAASMLRGLRQPVEGLPGFTVFTPFLLPFYGNDRLRAVNARLVRAQVQRRMQKLGMQQPHVVVTVPTAWDVAKDLERSSLVYNRSDKHSAFPEAATGVIARCERQLFAHADRVLYSSNALMDFEAGRCGERARLLDHGVDLAHFRPRPQTHALMRLGARRPILGFFGGLDDYVVDFDLLERIAVERPHCTLVLIGDATLSIERLTRHPNVLHLGFRAYRDIPDLGADFDVALMPWLDNAWIRSCNPIKLKEYLALGLEVVTTWFPEIERYRDHVHVARSQDAFLRQIDSVLQGRRASGDRRRLLAQSSWDQRARDLLEILDHATEATVPAAAKKPEAVACVGS